MDDEARSPQDDAAVIRLRGILKSFRGNSVLRGVDLAVLPRKSVAVMGGSGSGKSVLLKIAIGLLRADQGSVGVFGKDATRLDETGWEPLRRRAGMLFQAGALFDSMTVAENIGFPLRERGADSARIRVVVEERLAWVELPGIGDRKPSELSGGMRKRVALARTIATDPELIFYDEPTAGLDPLTGRKISELIRDVNARLGSTAVVVTHDLVCASIVADRWTFIAGGRIILDGSPEEFRNGPGEVREFIEAGSGMPGPRAEC
jgi:phospholipid/cholesterol/gamma-HCH transport system ATP-binding protein